MIIRVSPKFEKNYRRLPKKIKKKAKKRKKLFFGEILLTISLGLINFQGKIEGVGFSG